MESITRTERRLGHYYKCLMPQPTANALPGGPGAVLDAHCKTLLAEMERAGTLKGEIVITSAQKINVSTTSSSQPMYNFCANNYLGFSSDPELVSAAKRALDTHGLGMSSVRFICGTQDIHKDLERTITAFYQTEDTILFPSAFDANGGVFEALFGEADAIISDELNHASLIDGIRLCKSQRHRFRHMDLADLESILQKTRDCRMRVIVTDGVFSMDGHIADLRGICNLADRYNALVLVDDAHATGFMGKTGRGTAEHCGVQGRVHLTTSTLGKAMGGASGGYVTGSAAMVAVLRNKARPYLFSNSIAPPLVASSIAAFGIVMRDTSRRDKVHENARLFRALMRGNGFTVPGEHPIVPVMFGDARLAAQFARGMVKRGVFVVAFSYPVVPQGKARIRVQISAAHDERAIRACVDAFVSVRDEISGAR